MTTKRSDAIAALLDEARSRCEAIYIKRQENGYECLLHRKLVNGKMKHCCHIVGGLFGGTTVDGVRKIIELNEDFFKRCEAEQ